MHKEIADKWITALRSDEYAQTKGALEISPEYLESHPGMSDGVGFCCLGVLSALAAKEGIVTRAPDEFGNIRYGTSEDMCAGELPDAVMDWAGMSSTDGTRITPLDENDDYTEAYRDTLMTLNDSKGYTFKEIADVIEKEYQDL